MKTTLFAFIILVIMLMPVEVVASPTAATYYVSSSSGSDSNDGLSQGTAFANLGRVIALALQPGDQVLLKCGDTWRTDPLIINRSGSAAAPITFSSYPTGCANKPMLTGSRPVNGWVLDSGAIYPRPISPLELTSCSARGSA